MQFKFGSETVAVTHPTAAAMLAEVRARLAARRGFALATINLDHLVKLRRSPAFLRAYLAQDLVVADGNPIVWLSRLARRPVSLVPGSDMVIPLCRVAAETGASVALVGTTQAALEAAAAHLQAAVPGLQIGACIAPPFGFDPQGADAAALLAELQQKGIGLAFLALGAPKQELLAARGRALAPSVGFASVGAGLDFLAGTQTRAPAWVRAIAMEWLWRALSRPSTLIPRYAACAAILPGQAIKAMRLRTEA